MQLSGKRIRRITIIYWFLLLYIIAALVWWFVSLQQQNIRMAALRQQQLETKFKAGLAPGDYQEQLKKIETEKKRNLTKYVGEGITFLVLTIIGAAFVYRAIRKQFRLQQQQQNFMMAVTHELKTPVSVAKLNLETLLKYSLDEEKQKKLIRMTLQENSRLNFLTSNILASAQLEKASTGSAKEELNLSDLLKDCINDFRIRYPERKIIEEIEPDTEIKGDAFLLQLLINNLLENAVKYSAKEKKIICRLNQNEQQVILSVTDEGKGIPDGEKEKIFDKFYRVGNESTRKTQGTGLGLYLSRKIAADHNADIRVTDNKPSGSNFAVIFNK